MNAGGGVSTCVQHHGSIESREAHHGRLTGFPAAAESEGTTWENTFLRSGREERMQVRALSREFPFLDEDIS